ncbi:hypothetical protein, variant [Saprolegnia diclina VS20]|nr:hypothetical protein, variant [Saprolegnia diclina VS20]EQC42543.1 hypothetical protein, variant [Saprolegnia diclina VS20]|eukprot:XP_008603966.1 hypothetical protein, variant [Saprolegnia diclina VS20]
MAYLGLTLWTKALKDIDHAICIDANDADILVLRAKLHWKLGLIDKGNTDISRAFKLCPNHPEVLDFERKMWYQSQHLHDLACRHILGRDFAKALDCLNSCINFNAEDPKVLILRASVFRELRDYRAALTDVERASRSFFGKQFGDELDEHMRHVLPTEEHPEISRQRNLILNDMAIMHIQAGDFEAGLTAMNQAIASEIETSSRFEGKAIDYRYYINRGDCYRALGKLQAALADYNTARELQPTDTEIHTRIAMIRYHFGLELFNRAAFDKAEIEFSSAIRHNHKVPAFFIRRGDCFRYMDQSQLAYQDYLVASRLAPDDAEAKVKVSQYAQYGASEGVVAPRHQRRARAPTTKPTSVERAWRGAVQKDKAYKALLNQRPDLASPSKDRIQPLPSTTFEEYCRELRS